MALITRYLLRQVALAGLVTTIMVTIVVWLTQIIRLLDLVLDKGAPVALLFWLLALTVPTFLGLIIPLALSAAVMFVYYRLLLESELVVMRAAGMSNWRLARPVLLLCVLSVLGAYGIAFYGAPMASRELGRLEFIVKNDYAVALLRDGAFNKLGDGVTAYVREREGTSALRGILIYDASKPDVSTTLFAERGILQQAPDDSAVVDGASSGRIVLLNGTRQEKTLKTGAISELKFEQYAVDLAQFATTVSPGWRDPHERTLDELLHDAQASGAPPGAAGKLVAELHQRIAAPLLALGFPLLALAALLTAEVNRRGMTGRLAVGTLLVTAWQVLVLTGINLIPKHPDLVPFVYLLALGPVPFILLTLRGRSWRLPFIRKSA